MTVEAGSPRGRALDRRTSRRAGVFRRALRRETSRLRDPHRIAAVVILIRSYRASAFRECRDQIKWVLLGLVMGLGPFMALY